MPSKKVGKTNTKTSTSTDNVEHPDREASISGHERDERKRDAQKEEDKKHNIMFLSSQCNLLLKQQIPV